MKRIHWIVTDVLDRPGPLSAFVQIIEGEPEAGDVVHCSQTGRSYSVTSMALGLGVAAIVAGRRLLSFNVETDGAGLQPGMVLTNASEH